MNWFNNIKIRNKLYFVFGILLLTMISFAVFAVVEINSIGNDNNDVVNSYQARQIHVADATVDFHRMRFANLSRGYAQETADTVNIVSTMLEDYEKSAASFMENLAGLREKTHADSRLTESEKQPRLAMIDGIEDSFLKYVEVIGRLKATLETMDRQEVIKSYEESIPYGNDLSDKLQDLRDLVFSTTREKVWEITENTARTINLLSIIAISFIFISAFVLLFTVGNINRPILKLEKAVVEIANGNLKCPVRSKRMDELGSLANRIGDMVDKISEHNKTMAIMDNMDSMICVSDLDYNLLYVNSRLADKFGLDKEKDMNKKCYKVTRNKETPCAFCQLPALLPQKNTLPTKDFEYIWDDALNVWLGGTASIIRWVDGSMVHFQAVRDVSRQKQHEELLQEALEAAKTASFAKSSFLANMSHEIRTPMNAILGISEIQLNDETLDPATREALEKIHNSGNLLLSIINDILDLSKIEAGKLELTPAEYKVASLINDTATLNTMRIGSKPIEFDLSVDENTPTDLIGDELRIKQILNNLLSNSFKYTKKGVVKLSVSVEADGDKESDVTLVLRVSDTGQGMTEEQIGKLFDEYSRFNMEANRTTEGTGLGMSITRNLVRMMNGKIFVKSETGMGSIFIVRLPQKSAGADAIGRELAESLEKFQLSGARQLKMAQVVFEPMPYGSVLVVDDVESNLYVAKGLLTPYGLTIETVMSGFDAIDKIKNGRVYDIVFMDHMMPKMDGIEATKIIRELGYTHPVVALTANAVVGQSDIFLANGFDGFLSKPIDIRKLNASLKKFVRDKQTPEVIEAARQYKTGRQKNNGGRNEHAAGEAAKQPSDSKLAEIFLRDAIKGLAALEAIHEKRDAYSDEDIRIYVINVHGIKSALANIGEAELSAFALKLEQAGRANDTTVMAAETPAFLNELRTIIEKLSPQEEESGSGEAASDTKETREYLREMLLVVQEACETFDKKTAKTVIAELREKTWTKATGEQLGAMAEHLLNGDFGEVSRVAGKIIETM